MQRFRLSKRCIAPMALSTTVYHTMVDTLQPVLLTSDLFTLLKITVALVAILALYFTVSQGSGIPKLFVVLKSRLVDDNG